MSVNRRTLLAGLALCPICTGVARAAEGAHWTYEGHGGPEEWGSLEKGFSACSVGGQQSPVNLDGAMRAEATGPNLAWKAQAFKVANNGHTIQADVAGDGSTASLGGKTYTLRQFHFHAPSEHAIAGKRTAMEAHFVHAAADGGLLVVGVLMQAGGANASFSEVMKVAPAKAGTASAPVTIDPSGFLPAVRTTYRYEGSLTTPPCSEIVDWNVFATPIDVAQADIDAFRAIFPMNARPLQAMNRRFLLRLD